MKIIRISLHSLVLTITDISAILFGFWMYKLARIQWPVDQIAVQFPAALVFCVLAFAVWSWLVRRLVNQLALRGRGEYLWTYIAALLWSPAIFVPLHYVTQGYLTDIGNIIGLWVFQSLANIAALALVRWSERKSTNES